MTISEMHIMFRTIGQQKGMQLVRAILPEEIDDYLNAAIIEFVRTVVQTNIDIIGKSIGKTSTLSTDGITPYNAIRTLYTEVRESITQPLTNEYYSLELLNTQHNYMQIIGVNILYDTNGHIYPCRIITPSELANTLNDYCNKPDKEYPCCLITTNNIGNIEFHFYTNNNFPVEAILHVIKVPITVNYNNSVNCDLPDYVHQEIVERAVQKFFISVGATSNQNKQ